MLRMRIHHGTKTRAPGCLLVVGQEPASAGDVAVPAARQPGPGGRQDRPDADLRTILEDLLTQALRCHEHGNQPGAVALIYRAKTLLAASPGSLPAPPYRAQGLRRPAGENQAPPLPESLTPREETVLRLLCGTLSMREIADELCVSRNTVKTHVQQIYRKLAVSTRGDAVQRGRELGILYAHAKMSALTNPDQRPLHGLTPFPGK